jgi:hypothetical protein
MSGFPGDFSVDVGETEAEIEEAIEDYENDLKRSLTKTEKEYVRLSYTDPDAGSEFYRQNGLKI